MIKTPSQILEGLVLGASTYSENSAVITFASPSGLMPLLARGVYKPKSSLKPLLISGQHLRVEYLPSEKGVNLAKSLQVIDDVSSLYSVYTKNLFVLFFHDLSLSLYRYGDSFPLEDMILVLNALKQDKDPLSLALLMVGTFYRSLGLEMDIEDCLSCHKTKGIVSYSLEEGGFLCLDCLPKFPDAREKENLDLFVFKFAFVDINQENLSRVVPKENGIRVLRELVNHLVSYFDLKEIKSLDLFVSSLV